MTPRTIVAVEPGLADSLLVKVAKAPAMIPGAEVWRLFDCDPDTMPPWTQADAVREHGLTLRQKLASHPGVASALQQILSTPLKSRHLVCFQVRASEAERFRWEALWDDTEEFLSLDPRWPIGRIADSEIDLQPAPYVFAPPLKVMALLSALNVKAELEWQRLYEAIAAARQGGLEIDLRVWVGEEGLHQAILKDIRDGAVTGVRAATIPRNTEEFKQAAEYAPHVLHFFCHGSAGFGKPQLELATVTDWDLGTAENPLVLGLKQLAAVPGLSSTWLVTLNCCEGGKASSDLHSMAHSLVANGVPAAVGMLEPIDAGDAHEFCGAFYTAAFRAVQGLLQVTPPGEVGVIEWIEALHPPRSILSQSHPHPTSRPEWTLPVVYVRPERFQVQVRLEAPAVALPPKALQSMRLRAEAVATTLRGLPPDTPAEVRDQILDLLADVPPALRPDRHGNFLLQQAVSAPVEPMDLVAEAELGA